MFVMISAFSSAFSSATGQKQESQASRTARSQSRCLVLHLACTDGGKRVKKAGRGSRVRPRDLERRALDGQ